MKKQIVNNKVLKGVAIAMSAMMAITSVPFGSFAVEPETTETVEQAVTPVDALEAVKEAEKEVEEHYEETKKEPQKESHLDQTILEELSDAEKSLNNEALQDEELVILLVESEVLDQNVDALEKSLTSDYLLNDDKDLKGKDRLKYNIERDADGNLVINEEGNPIFSGNDQAESQLSGQYGDDGRSVQGVYQSGMQELKNSVNESNKGNEKEAKEYLSKAEGYLDSANSKFENSTKQINEANEQYNAAKDAYEKANAALQNKTQQLGDAIKYSEEARKSLAEAQEKADKLEKMCNQYYGVLLQYYKDVQTSVFDENGKLDIEKSVENTALLSNANNANNDKVNKGSGFSNQFFELNRELLEQLVTYKLEDEGASDIVFEPGTIGAKDSKTEKTAVISKDRNGNDMISKYNDAGIHKWENVSGENGRNNHVMVTYKDKDGEEKTKYYNYVIKGNDYEKENIHFENGPIYVAEVTKGTDNKWHYAHYDPNNSEFLDNYNSLVKAADDYKEAKAKVDAAAEKVNKLKAELENVEEKVATNGDKLAELAGMLETAQVAYENSKRNLKDFQDVYNKMYRNLYPEEFIEKPGDTVPQAPAATEDTADDDDDADNGDAAVPGAGDAGTFTLQPFAGIVPGAAAGAGTAGTQQNRTAGVAGVRVNDADNNAAGNDQAVQIDNNATPKEAAPASSDSKESTEKTSVNMSDPEIPLAASPNMDDEVTMNWMWLLIIFLLGATGKKMYDEYKKKKEEEEETRRNKASM